jgi:hypothetical protein
MSERNWRRVVVFGVVLLTASAVATAFSSFDAYRRENRRAYDDDAARNAAEARQVAIVRCGEFSGAALTLCLDSAVSANAETSEPDYDLQAQQEMAEWAFAMWWTSLFGAAITAVGVVYVARTLRAALDANRGFKESAERQLRPYVVFETVELTQPLTTRVHIQPRWKNSGQTPTRNARVNWGVRIGKDRLPADFDYPEGNVAEETAPMPGRITLGAGETRFGVGPFVDVHDMAAVDEGKTRIFVWGWLEYNDGFPDTPRRRSEFCVQILKSQEGRVVLQTGPHNGLDEECLNPVRTSKDEN